MADYLQIEKENADADAAHGIYASSTMSYKRAAHHNDGKPMVHLPGYAIIRGISFVLEWAANRKGKYGLHDWRQGMPWSEVLASSVRHLQAVCDGEWLDPESGKPHVWHAATNLMFLIQYMDEGIGTDDIYRSENE